MSGATQYISTPPIPGHFLSAEEIEQILDKDALARKLGIANIHDADVNQKVIMYVHGALSFRSFQMDNIANWKRGDVTESFMRLQAVDDRGRPDRSKTLHEIETGQAMSNMAESACGLNKNRADIYPAEPALFVWYKTLASLLTLSGMVLAEDQDCVLGYRVMKLEEPDFDALLRLKILPGICAHGFDEFLEGRYYESLSILASRPSSSGIRNAITIAAARAEM